MKKILITGASRGIGKATAQKFLGEGWSVIGTSRSGTASIHHPAFKIYALNLLDSRSIEKKVDSGYFWHRGRKRSW
ncbi:MAG: hypothetical protein A2W19_10780 [Spirochaetes bacterium RBG_16_49_21]|nr:MAG: hypothetical protein A2W19_10780 [Spirochaetes bacterium RBG_16_49_21]